jgi:hypothetical protein
VIPATAYRQKLRDGGSGIVILRSDCRQPGIASISKSSEEAIPAANTPKDFYPQEAFDEAISLTSGMPYNKRKAPAPTEVVIEVPEETLQAISEEDAAPENKDPVAEVVIDSSDYQKILDAYTDKDGKFSYSLLNKDMIKFAYNSSTVRAMTAENVPTENITLYVAGSKFRSITGNNKLSDEEVLKIIELLDDVSPKGVFREFNEDIRQRSSKKSKR